ncbi:MAG TPA: hypothetical protein PKG52_12380 [bacterium]|nr:hypothetical protein [bacterium]HPS31592.1 hypothetical protein [bacterium]
MFVFPGFNSNIEHRNKNYHVQTEVNSVAGKYRVNTLVYLSGSIYSSMSSELTSEESLNRETSVSAIRKQHNKIIRDLISDQLDPQKSSTDKELLDFVNLYKDAGLFSCDGKCFSNARETYRKLLLPAEEEMAENK